MDQERNSAAGFQNRDSFLERMNSNMSIDRFTRRSNSPRMGNKISLIEAMDLQLSDRKSDLYNNILGDHRRSSNHNRESNMSRNETNERISRQSQHNEMIEQPHQSRRSSGQKHVHDCNCSYQQCHGQHCNCFLYPNELCIIGLCCLQCVKLKNQFLSKQQQSQSTNGCLCKNIKCLKMYCSCYRQGKKCNPKLCKCEGCQNDSNGLLDRKKKKIQFEIRKQQPSQRQNYHLYPFNQNKKPVDPTTYSFVNCSCKKSHCLKKYCSCFINNKSCTQSCSCEDCHNKFDENDFEDDFNRKARYARHNDDDDEFDDEKDQDQIDQFLQKSQKEESDDIPQHMEFEPVNFDSFGR